MIIEISVAVIAACFVLILFRLYALSIRIEDTTRRIQEFISRTEAELWPLIHDARNTISDISGIMDIARRQTKKIEYTLENLMSPVQTLLMFIKAIKTGINTFLKKERG